MKKKNTNPFGTEAEIEEVLHKLTKPGYQNSNLALSQDATIEEKFKYEICQSIARHKLRNRLSLEAIAELLDLDKKMMDKLLRCHIELFDLEDLASYAELLAIPLRIVEESPQRSRITRKHF